MARNRFEQVDEKQEDAITLSLCKAEDNVYGTVTVPKALSAGKVPTDLTTSRMPIKDAFRGAIRLANGPSRQELAEVVQDAWLARASKRRAADWLSSHRETLA